MLPLITCGLLGSHCLSVLLARASGNPETSWGGTVTAIDTRLDLDIIESLDFEYMPPCESPSHEVSMFHAGDAYALASMTTTCCNLTFTGYRCRPIVKWALKGKPMVCPGCNRDNLPIVKVLAYVDGA